MAGPEIGVNFAGGCAVNIVTAMARQTRYCYEFNKLVTDLSDEQEYLKSTTNGMQRQLDRDKANSKEHLGDLQLQLRAANKLIDKVEKLKGKEKAKQRCCNGVCLNWICLYYIGKKAAEKTKAMKELNEQLRYKLLSSRLSLLCVPPSEDYIPFNTTKEVRNEILMALTDDKKTKIGLYGMGGCGKTSMLRQVHKELQDSGLYKTAFVVVSNPPDYLAIQNSIASWIGLEFKMEKTVLERAARLSMSFQTGKKYLVILDNVWQKLDFEAIRIPVGENCKVLLSTRQLPIFHSMEFDAWTYMPLITKEEAWELFQKHAGEIKDPFRLVAREITDECHRLPIAIKAVASTLRGKELFAWTEALATLKDHRKLLNIVKGLEDPYKCLKRSLDELEDAEEASLYLLCALFPSGSEIAIEVLIRFAFGLGIFTDVNSYHRARPKVHNAIAKFKDYCLLEHEGQFVKLHGMFHALALWEAKKTTQVITEPRQIISLREADYLKDTKRLYCHGIEEITDPLNCPELEVLILFDSGSGYSSNIRDIFFAKMIKLKVLSIKNASTGANPYPYLLMPHSMEGLKKLRTLCLRGWTLTNTSMFEKLEMLETIELLDCVMEELPRELVKLTALKLLEASNCMIGGNPYKVLATCSHLEELYFVDNEFPEIVNVAEFFHQIGSFTVLQRYHLGIGGSVNTFKNHSPSKLISINNFDASIIKKAFQELSQTLQVLFFEKIQGDCKSIIPDMFPIKGEYLNELKEFVLCDSDCIKCLIDTTNDQLYQTGILFAKLQKLKLEAMEHLEVLCHGPPPPSLFEKLKELFITNCRQLTSLFTTMVARKMVMLEVLEVIDCNNLRHIINVEDNDEDVSVGHVFPNLKQIIVKRCNNLNFLLPISVASGLLQLETVEIKDTAGLQYVFGSDEHEKEEIQTQIRLDLSAVRVFNLMNLENIISICPQNYDLKLPLEKTIVTGCPRLSGILDLGSEVKEQVRGEEARNLTEEAKILERKAEASMSCCNGVFLNWLRQYSAGKREERMTKTGKQFNESLNLSEDHLVDEARLLTMASGSNEVIAIHQEEEVPPSHTAGLTHSNEEHRDQENQRGCNDIPSESFTTGEGHAAEEVHSQLQEFENVDTQEGFQKERFCPVDSMNLQESSIKIGEGSLHKYTELEGTEVGISTEESMDKQPKVELDANVTKVQDATEVHPQSKEFDATRDTQEGLQEQNFCSVISMNLRENKMEIAEVDLHKDPVPDESTVGTSSQVLIDKQAQEKMDPQRALPNYKEVLSPSTSITTPSPTSEALISSSTKQQEVAEELTARHQHKLPEDDSHSEVQEEANIHVQSQIVDIIGETHESFHEHHFYPVGSINLRESNKEITKRSIHGHPTPKESTARTSSQKLIEKQPQVELEVPQVTLPRNRVSLPQPVHPSMLSLGSSITINPLTPEASTSSSTKQHSIAEELADLYGLTRRACLLDDAFVKYPQLWNWKISQKSSRFCKWGYESLTDMLELLISEKPKTMDDSKRKKFEDLCLELESFRFDKEWLASIRQRVMDMQDDHNDKLKQLVQLKFNVSSLEEQLNDARARMDSIEHDLSKLDNVFGL